MSKLSTRGDSHDKTNININQQLRKHHTPEFRDEALKLAERIGVAAAAREVSLYESKFYAWRSKQQQMTSSERESELAILQKAATYFAKRLNLTGDYSGEPTKNCLKGNIVLCGQLMSVSTKNNLNVQ